MTINPIYTRTVMETVSLKDVYGHLASTNNIVPKGYKAIDFRLIKTGDQYITTIDNTVRNAEQDNNCIRLIVEKLPEPIIFNPSLFGVEAAKLYGTDNIMLKVGYCLYGFMTKYDIRRNDVLALSPELKNMCPKVDILNDFYKLIWIYKES